MSNASLLIILGEPHYENQLRPILDRVLEGLTVWDEAKAGADLNTELLNFINKNVQPEKVEGGTILRSEGKVYIEVLVHPTVALLTQCLQNILYQNTAYKLIVHAGPAYQGTGSWILRDGTFSSHDFARFIHRNEIASVLRERAETSATTISCLNEGEWNDNGFKHHDVGKRYAINAQQSGAHVDLQCGNNVVSYFNRYMVYCELTESMPSSNIVGSVRFRRPTIYMFPAGQGDAALFGVSGFTLLLDGGYQWKSCFWDFLRHVDRIDAMVVTRANANTINGTQSFVKRLALHDTHPKLGYMFMNTPTHGASDESTSKNPLLVSVFEQTFDVVDCLKHLHLSPHPLSHSINPATKHVEPLTLYQKVGHGRLEMYVLNPVKDSKELNEFTQHWKRYVQHSPPQSYSAKPGSMAAYPVPLLSQMSVAVLIVWHPASTHDNVIRVFYPGSCPQERLFSSLEKLKHLEFLKHPACTPGSLESGKGVKGAPIRKPELDKGRSPTPNKSTNHHPTVEHHAGTAAHVNHLEQRHPPSHAPVSPKVETSSAFHAPHVAAAAEHHLVDDTVARHGLSTAAAEEHHEKHVHHEPEHHVTEQSAHHHEPDPVHHHDEKHTALHEHAAHEHVSREEHIGHGHGHVGHGEGHEHDFDHVEHPHHAVDLHNQSAAIEEKSFNSHEAGGESIDDSIVHSEHGHHESFTHEQAHEHHGKHDEEINRFPEPLIAVCPPKPDLVPESLHHTSDNTSDVLSPLSPANSSEGASKDSPPSMERAAADDSLFSAHSISPHPPQSISPIGHGESTNEQLSISPDMFGERKPRLNPDAPEFVPRHSISSDDATGDQLDLQLGGKSSVSPALSSPSEPVGKINGNSHVHAEMSEFDAFAHKAAAHGHGAAGDDDAFGMHQFQHPEGKIHSGGGDLLGEWEKDAADLRQEAKKSHEDLMNEWGKPLGAPPPVSSNAAAKKTTKAASAEPAAAASAKPKTAPAAKKPAAPAAAGAKQSNGAEKPAAKAAPVAAAKKATTVTTVTKTTTVTTSKAPAAAAAKPAPKPAPPKPATPAAKAPVKSSPAAATKSTTPATAKSQPSSGAKKAPAGSTAAFYVDLTYIPHNGNPHFVNSDFFKNVRSKYYVLSALQAPKETLDALLAGKKAWNLPEEEVTLIPTYDSDHLNLWMSLRRDELSMESIDVAPSCARCSLNLEEHHGTVCAAYRLEL